LVFIERRVTCLYFAVLTRHSVGQSIVKITVDDTDMREVFYVDKALVCARSKFFRAALNSEWKEGEENAIALPEDDPEIFATYLELVYTGKIACKKSGVTILELQTNENSDYYDESYEPSESDDDSDDDQDSEDGSDDDEETESDSEDLSGGKEILDVKCSPLDREWEDVADYKFVERTKQYASLIELYILSDKLIDVVAMNKIMQGFIETAKDYDDRFPNTSLISYAVENTHRDSTLQNWLRDIMVEEGNAWLPMIEEEELPKSFWCELAQELAYRRRGLRRGFRHWEMAELYRD
jgi:hypothetical protein